jgi:hypothetical protein
MNFSDNVKIALRQFLDEKIHETTSKTTPLFSHAIRPKDDLFKQACGYAAFLGSLTRVRGKDEPAGLFHHNPRVRRSNKSSPSAR